MRDVIIIGGGPAGLTAAIYAVRAGLDTLVLEANQLGGQVAVSAEVDNYPAVPHTMGWVLANSMAQQVESMDVPIQYARVTALERTGEGFRLGVEGGEDLTCRSVILANGAKRRKLGCPGEEEFLGRGVSYCATCDGAFFKGRDVAVMGGGNTAVEDALYLAGICRSVTLIFRRDRLTAQRKLVEAAEGKENLRLCPRSLVTAVTGGDLVEAVEITGAENGEKRSLPVSALFVAIGLEPDNAPFAPPLALDDYGYILAGEDCKTNVPGVFAAGDSRTKLLRQIVTAVADGAVAAMQAERFLHG